MHLLDRRTKRYPEARTPDELEAPATGNKLYYDNGHKNAEAGFACRVTAAGHRAFVLNYRVKGRERRYKIGDYPGLSVVAARKAAGQLKQEIREGKDPLAKKQADRTAPTVADLCERYKERHLPKKRESSQKDDLSMIERDILPKLGGLKVSEVTYDDIDKLHTKITKKRGAPYRANRVVSLLSKMFNLAIKQWHMRDGRNPCEGIERNSEAKRKRYLKPDELARLVSALDGFADTQAANMVRLLLLTGARFGEVAGARWDQFDLEVGKWTKPASTTKQNTEHEVPLSPEAVQLLQELWDQADDTTVYVFPGRDDVGHRVDLKKPWPAILKAAGISGLRVHDLRHSYASFLVSAGESLPVIGALLGHSQPGTTQRYAHLHNDPLRKATGHVGVLVRGAGKTGAKVVKLGQRDR